MAGAQYNMRNPAVKRLMKEAQELKDPTEQYFAQPLDDNLFEWHFTIRGPADSDFDSGIYHGRILLPPEYPMKPPSIILLTPNGRFELNSKICLSISGHHPESWRPSWSIRTAILAIIGFMPTPGSGAIGSLDYPAEERKKLARRSQEWKCQQCGSIKNLLKPVTEASKETQKEAQKLASQISFKAEEDKKKDPAVAPAEKENTPPAATAQTTQSVPSQPAGPGFMPFGFPQNMTMFPPFQGMPPFPQTTESNQGQMPGFPPMPFQFPFGQMPMMGMIPGQVPTSNQGQPPSWPPGTPFNPYAAFWPPMYSGLPSFPGMTPEMAASFGNTNTFLPGQPGVSQPPTSTQASINSTIANPGVPSSSGSQSNPDLSNPNSPALPATTSSSLSAPASSASITESSSSTTTDSGLRQRNVGQALAPQEAPETARNVQYAEVQPEPVRPPLIDTFSFVVFILCSIGIALLMMRRLGIFDTLLSDF